MIITNQQRRVQHIYNVLKFKKTWALKALLENKQDYQTKFKHFTFSEMLPVIKYIMKEREDFRTSKKIEASEALNNQYDLATKGNIDHNKVI